MQIKSLAHVCIRTKNLKQTEKFYCDALGIQKFFNFTRNGKVIGYYLKLSDRTFIEVFEANETVAGNGPSLAHFCLETTDIKAARQALTNQGYVPGEIKMGCDQSLQLWVNDPNGIALELHQYTGDSSQYSGKDVEVNW